MQSVHCAVCHVQRISLLETRTRHAPRRAVYLAVKLVISQLISIYV